MLRSIRLAFCLCVLAIAMIMAGCGGAHAPNNVRQALTLSGVVRELGPGGVPQPAADAEVGVALDGKSAFSLRCSPPNEHLQYSIH
jgi:hypothetical protein